MPLLWLSLAFLAGIGLSDAAAIPPWAWALGAGLLAAAAFFERRWLGRFERWQRWRAWSFVPAAALLAAVCLGGWRNAAHVPEWGAGDLAYYQPAQAQVRGVIDQPPRPAGQGVSIFMQAEQVTLLDESGEPLGPPVEVRGRLEAVLRAGQELRYGDRVELTGTLEKPPEGQSGRYARYLQVQGVYSSMAFPLLHWVEGGAGSPFWEALFRLRQQGVETINRLLPQPESSLLAGILLGEEVYIPADVQNAFSVTGTAHIIAISGFNIAVLVSLFLALFRAWLPRLWAVLAAAAAILLYTLLVGAQASVVRAAIMGVMGLVGAELLGRRQAGANSLAFSAALMALFNPPLLWDVGFQLSFTATLGLILLGVPMQTAFTTWLERHLPSEWARKLAAPVGDYFLLTLAAQLATLPVILGNFGSISWTSILVNPLILPVQPLIMILGGIGLLVGMVWLPLGQLLGWLAWVPLAYTIRVVQLFAQFSQGQPIYPQIALLFTALFYSLLFLRGWWRRLLGRWFSVAVWGSILFLLAAVLARAVLAAPDGLLHVTVFNAGKYPLVLIRAPGGGTVLVNGGEQATQLQDQLGRWLSPLSNSLDYLLVPNKDRAAIQALVDSGERYQVQNALWNNRPKPTDKSEELLLQLQKRKVPLEFMQPGQELDLGGGAFLRVLAVSPDGAALWLGWGNFSLLLPGGIPPDALREAGMDWPPAPGFLLLAEPDLGQDPAPDWGALLPGQGIILGQETIPEGWFNLKKDGWLHITTDGSQAWLESGP